MQSKARTVAEYVKSLPPDRRKAIEAVRQVILKNLPRGYEECMQYGMIGYVVPHSIYPAGYHCNPELPLGYAALASQRNYMSLYLCTVYGHKETESWFRKAFKDAGKKLDMGKSCVRFKKVEDLPLDVIGEVIARVPVKDYVATVEKTLQGRKKK